ncbi:cadmium-translocating P-type ATPase [Actinomarinicola tropica]|uniref:Cadmium-translocating P-type ATPase n=1 Tax=Actinomarinicola tropica TaxID=2789776 RepID=A0A5Q2RP94_9ACTN|nr:cadmium-translocating P-type ATPase [Actinomarinicola tropica]
MARRLDVDLLMVVAAVAAAMLGQWRDGSLLIFIFATTGALEEAATERTAAGVRALLVDAPESAERLEADGGTTHVAPDDLLVGDRVLVRPGARIPSDGVVVDGEAAVDESSLTDEPLPVRKVAGRTVFAGATVTEGALVVEATEVTADSTLARLAAAVDEAIEQQPPTQLFIERFEQRYSIGVVATAVLLVVVGPWWWGWTTEDTVMRIMTFLVVASPCAVVLATMPTTLSALAAAARHGVLIRGGAVLERLAAVDLAAFDKTGTITIGSPQVVDIALVSGRSGTADQLDEDTLLGLAAAAERWSEHPIGQAIVTAATERGIALAEATDVELIPSRGVQATVDSRRVRVGGAALLGDLDSGDANTVVGIEVDGTLRARLTLDDEIRVEASCTVACLVDGGVRETWLLTGDRITSASRVATAVGIDHHAYDLLPDGKADAIRRLGVDGHRVVYVGDGVNDAAAQRRPLRRARGAAAALHRRTRRERSRPVPQRPPGVWPGLRVPLPDRRLDRHRPREALRVRPLTTGRPASSERRRRDRPRLRSGAHPPPHRGSRHRRRRQRRQRHRSARRLPRRGSRSRR